MNRSTPGLPIHHQLPECTKLMSIELVIPSNHLILCRPLLLLPPILPSTRVFSNESSLRMRWSKYWSFSFSISPSSEHPGLISFRMDWLDLLAVQGTLRSLLQHHSSRGDWSLLHVGHQMPTDLLSQFIVVQQFSHHACTFFNLDCHQPHFSFQYILSRQLQGYLLTDLPASVYSSTLIPVCMYVVKD